MDKCMKFPVTGKATIFLHDYQKKVVEFITKPQNHSILLWFSLGSGKTITSLAMANCLMELYPNKHVMIITPSSLVSTFEKEAKRLKFKWAEDPTKLFIESYTIFINKAGQKKHLMKDTILIIDEAQGLNGENSVRFKKIFGYSKKAFKLILLSATPVKNSPQEISNILSFLNRELISRYRVEGLFNNPDPESRRREFEKLLKCKVSYYDKKDHLTPSKVSDYPEVEYKTKRFKMTKDYYLEYYKIQENIKHEIPELFQNVKNLTVFLNGIRRAVNSTTYVSPKVTFTLKVIKKSIDQNKKILVYSNWLDAGVNIIQQFLTEYKIPFSMIVGNMKKDKKDSNIADYNTGKTKIILISSSGGEGISLKGTRNIIIMEPHWNDAKIEQIIGRGIRYKSHAHLLPQDRNVTVYKLILEKPDQEDLVGGDNIPSADDILYKLSKSKKKEIDAFYDMLKGISREPCP